MSAIPYPLDPLGKHSPYFQLVVKPGILGTSLTYGFTPYFEDGGYCKVVDWGDGTSEDATANTTLKHIYAAAGTYTVRIKANCRGIRFGPQTSYAKIIYDTNANWSALGNFTWAAAMFAGCVNAQFKIDKLPESLQDLGSMFRDCYKAELYIHKLPEKLSSCYAAFKNCYKAVINLDELVANAPAEGWSKGVKLSYMFCDAGSGNSPGTVTGSRSAFLAKFPRYAQSYQIFTNTNTTP